jgi:hypothetical protein
MAMRSFAVASFALISLVACSKKAPPPPASSTTTTTEAKVDPQAEQPLGDSGYLVTLPPGFTLKPSSVDGFWDVVGPYETFGTLPHVGTVAGIAAFKFGAASLDSMKKSCTGKGTIIAETLPTGGHFVQCSSSIKAMGMDVQTQKLRLEIGDEKSNVSCYEETDNPTLLAFTAKVCRSIRKR